jgi:hypothetical protein
MACKMEDGMLLLKKFHVLGYTSVLPCALKRNVRSPSARYGPFASEARWPCTLEELVHSQKSSSYGTSAARWLTGVSRTCYANTGRRAVGEHDC